MDTIAAALLAISAMAVLVLPRRWAPGALLVGTCYVTRAQGIELGPLSFTVFRILIAFGLLRIIVRGDWKDLSFSRLDWLMTSWGTWMLLSVALHRDPANQIIERLGFVFDAWGTFIVLRCLCRTVDDALSLCRLLSIVLVPIAVSMLMEKATARNLFAFLGGVPELATIREGHVRARGPFAHPILAGTIGATCLPLTISMWKQSRFVAVLGISACAAMVFASGSSGPILSAAAGGGALMMWRYRHSIRAARWAAIMAYVALEIVMKDPAYYILARIDLTGGSTGWHRARLIESAFEHFREWWLGGTDYTRHWMASGVSWSPDHADITNQYLQMGVLGGLPLALLFVAIVMQGFVLVGRALRAPREETQFALWAFGASWFAHAATCVSVSYFDQSVVFLYFSLGLINSSQHFALTSGAPAEQPSPTTGAPEKWRSPARVRHWGSLQLVREEQSLERRHISERERVTLSYVALRPRPQPSTIIEK